MALEKEWGGEKDFLMGFSPGHRARGGPWEKLGEPESLSETGAHGLGR